VQEIRHRTGNWNVDWHCVDLSSLKETADLADRVADSRGRLDVLVNNAGVGPQWPGDGRRLESRASWH
jgi:NAD(P)-dependent dehydrogenase (short-subunit alcohol dehydrogenase family)